MTNTSKKNPFEIGDILYGDVGYTMALPTWYQVVGVTPCSVKVKRRAYKIVSGNEMSGTSTCDLTSWYDYVTDIKSARVSSERGQSPTKKNSWVKIGINYFSIWDGEAKSHDHFD